MSEPMFHCNLKTIAVLEIKKKSRLSLFKKPGNQTREFGCPDESLVVRYKNLHI